MKKRVTFICLITALAFGCASTYTTENFDSYVPNHKTLAILPFKVIIKPHPRDKNATIENITKMQEEEAFLMQQYLYSRLLRKKQDYRYSVDFIDIDKINALLHEQNLTYDDIINMPKEKIAEITGADAIMSGYVVKTQPFSKGGALALGIASTILSDHHGGIWLTTDEVDIQLKIHDGRDGNLIWSYEGETSGSVGS